MPLANFHDVSFPLNQRFGARIGLRFKTSVSVTRNQDEQRNCEWLDPLYTASFAPVAVTQADIDQLLDFVRARQGLRYAFRWRNYLDYEAAAVQVGTGNGDTSQYQLVQAYASGITGDTYTAHRIVMLPVTVVMTLDGTARTHFVFNTTTGVVTFGQEDHTVTLQRVVSDDKITSDTGFNWVTFGVQVGDLVKVVGTAALDGTYTVSAFADSNTSLVVTGGNFSSSETGVTADILFPPVASAVVRWTGTYDTPARFARVDMPTSLQELVDYQAAIEIIEERAQAGIAIGITEAAIPSTVVARLPVEMSARSTFAPEQLFLRVDADSGHLEPVTQGAPARSLVQAAYPVRTIADMHVLRNFAHARKGRFCSFNTKDWIDYTATTEAFGTGDNSTTVFQLAKVYSDSGGSTTRTIRRPVSGTVTIFQDGVAHTQNTINTTTGQVTFTLGTITITFASVGSTLTRSSGSWLDQGVTVGDKITITGSASNNTTFTVTGTVTATVLTVVETVTDEGPVAVTVLYPPLTGVALTWSGEFDELARFDTDTFEFVFSGRHGHVEIADFPLRAVSEATIGSGYLAGSPGRSVTAPLSCAMTPLDPGPINKRVFRMDEGHAVMVIDFASPETAKETQHYPLAGWSGYTFCIAFQRWQPPGVLLCLPGPQAPLPPSGTSPPNGDDYVPLLMIEVVKSGAGNNLMMNTRVGPGAVGLEVIGSTCSPKNSLSSDTIIEVHGDGLGSHAAGYIDDLVVLVVTVSLSELRVWISGSFQADIPLIQTNGFKGWYCESDAAGNPIPVAFNTDRWQGQRGTPFVEVKPSIGGMPNLSNAVIRRFRMDLLEIICCQHSASVRQRGQRFMERFHNDLLCYFLRRYRLHQNPIFHPGEPLVGWWTMDHYKNTANGVDPFNSGADSWPSIGGYVQHLAQGDVALTPEIIVVNDFPTLPVSTTLKLFNGLEPTGLV